MLQETLLFIPSAMAIGIAIYLIITYAFLPSGDKHPRFGSGAVSAWVLAGLAVLGLTGGFLGPLEWKPLVFGFGGNPEAISFGIRLDRLSGTMMAFIAAMGFVVQRYSSIHLRGEGRARLFLIRMSITIAAALVQVLSPGLAQFALAWLAVSFGLQGLLRTEAQRPGACAAARLKFLFSRAGDLFMLLAIFSALVKYGGTDLSLFMSSAGDLAAMVQAPAWMAHGSMEGVREWSPAPAYFLVFAALFKAASLPFHGWLLGSLEAPTPVSALLHAGIINAGGFLLIRFQHLFEGHPHALVLLAILALPSVVLGPLAMWSQTDYKRGLAWSTIGQMGFMLLQCALGAFGPALLHLFGHGLYKANAFLRSGELAGMTEPGARSARTLPGPVGMVLALLASAAGLGAVYTLLLGNPGAVPGGWVLFSIQSLAVAQLALSPIARGPAFSGRMAASFIAGLGYAGVTVAFESLFAPVMAGLPALEMQGGAGLAAGGIALLALVTLTSLWLGMAWWIRKPWGKTLYVAAAHGYYLNPALTGGLASFRTQARLASLPATSAKKEVT